MVSSNPHRMTPRAHSARRRFGGPARNGGPGGAGPWARPAAPQAGGAGSSALLRPFGCGPASQGGPLVLICRPPRRPGPAAADFGQEDPHLWFITRKPQRMAARRFRQRRPCPPHRRRRLRVPRRAGRGGVHRRGARARGRVRRARRSMTRSPRALSPNSRRGVCRGCSHGTPPLSRRAFRRMRRAGAAIRVLISSFCGARRRRAGSARSAG